VTFIGQGRHTLRSISDPVYPYSHRDKKNSVTGTERQRKLLLHPSQENKPAHKHNINNEQWNKQTNKQNSCDELTTDKSTILKYPAGT